MALVLEVKTGESVYIDTPEGRVQVVLDQLRGGKAKLAFIAPRTIRIGRHETQPPKGGAA